MTRITERTPAFLTCHVMLRMRSGRRLSLEAVNLSKEKLKLIQNINQNRPTTSVESKIGKGGLIEDKT